ncbi:hydroxyethylthiazole kinase [Ceraceosorus bombacis]|uniref:Hydroxyethylthiazole kinase n=1 Tax=Ceraceosorus bombacis TaxID=401625 RepID=A0A0P1BGC6_9BASI|nr:hydroxyethylthiazole kinase [Ceraceosorus bombacis]
MTKLNAPDYSLYLVTSRQLLPPGVDFYDSLRASLKGGVTLVQIREKHADNGELLEIAQKSLKICDEFNVPLLINDNLAVALALPERVGLHIGQEDFPVAKARALLGPKRLLGISVHTVEQAAAARTSGANYAGVGAVYGTLSKANVTEDKVLGPRRAAHVIEALQGFPSVLIGGINQRTAARALFGAAGPAYAPAGIAVISAIVARQDAQEAARELKCIVNAFLSARSSAQKPITSAFGLGASRSQLKVESLVSRSGELLRALREGSPPLIQTLTSHVSSTLSANVTLALSASPIMSHQDAEADDLGNVTGAVVLNIGTIGEEARRGMRAVGSAANRGGKPVVLDPVGVGASAFRRQAVNEIMDHTQITLLKGNAAELGAIAGLTEVQSRGVDSGSGTLRDARGLVLSLARRERCLVLLTGKTDYLSDGEVVITCSNGHALLGAITGSGCALGVAVATGLAAACLASQGSEVKGAGSSIVKAQPDDLLAGALFGILSMTIASELAAARPEVRGPGTFIPALLDELSLMTPETFAQRAKVALE